MTRERINAEWVFAPNTQAVCRALTDGGAQALFVGGCVRNALLEVPLRDIDISTDAVPERVIELVEAAGLKAVPTGIAHGTVTVVAGHEGFEVTTFRRDVATDGRRAVVAFSTEVADDAARRDFTMNALYARPDGTVLDPLGGMPDLEARRVRFIGNAHDRLHEDYLRALRYFRFHAWYGDHDAGMDPEALAAIGDALDGLDKISRERVGHEMHRFLEAVNPAPSVAAMRQCGALGALLPGADDRAMAPLIHLEGEAGVKPDAARRLAALGGGWVAESLRLPKAEIKRIDRIRTAAEEIQSPEEMGYRLKADARDGWLLRCALTETPWHGEDGLAAGRAARFPLKARDLMPDLQGPELGDTLERLENLWIASGFTLTRDELFAQRG
ncbi:CCA tRNA nucleotidyltransferase [Chachezhania antarctica]|uniref:CCA tRNA nucleotidyltransferase n=1 Tax=Chachezhania antarctica TaxID=2340860 RepID=UPI000EB47990|nr:CCA tRNA nucleotidyltransferase [Chachezhania antarctica]